MRSAARRGAASPLVRLAAGLALLGVLFWRVGGGPFLHGVRSLDAAAVITAVVLTALTTGACAWRWSVISRALGVAVPYPAAVAAYYRSQFLNATLPGGVVGDVHRGVRYGRRGGDLATGLRAVGWERAAGQAVHVVIAFGVLLSLPSPVRSVVPLVGLATIGAAALLVFGARWMSYAGDSLPARAAKALRRDVHRLASDRRVWPAVLSSSVFVAGCHVALFIVAARVVGVPASLETMLPLAVLVLLATAVPVNIAGWGPREGAAAAVFVAVQLGAAQGIATATAMGVMTLAGVLPGAGVVAVSALRSRRAAVSPAGSASQDPADRRRGIRASGRKEAVHG